MTILSVPHRLWRWLPQDARRRLYARATELMAPGLGSAAARPFGPPWTVAGPLSAPTGLGEAARLAAEALEGAGEPTRTLDLSAVLRQTAVVANPVASPMRPEVGTLLLFVSPPVVATALAACGRARLAGKRRVGCWAWELGAAPAYWRRQATLLDEVTAPSRFSASALENILGRPVAILSHPVAIREAAEHERLGRSIFRVGMAFDLGSTEARKNPLAAIAAFRDAFGSGDMAVLVIKARDLSAEPAARRMLLDAVAALGPRAELTEDDLDAHALDRWWSGLDVFLSLHRSEGFGLLVAEAMHRGLPVIATDWSATAEYLDNAVGWPVRCEMVPARDRTERYVGAVWAEPDVTCAAAALRHAQADVSERRARGARARERIRERFTAAAFLRELTAAPAGLDTSARPSSHDRKVAVRRETKPGEHA